jgi:hypothetical protein
MMTASAQRQPARALGSLATAAPKRTMNQSTVPGSAALIAFRLPSHRIASIPSVLIRKLPSQHPNARATAVRAIRLESSM